MGGPRPGLWRGRARGLRGDLEGVIKWALDVVGNLPDGELWVPSGELEGGRQA